MRYPAFSPFAALPPVCPAVMVLLTLAATILSSCAAPRTSPNSSTKTRAQVPKTAEEATQLSENGRALLPIVVAASASVATRQSAATLTEYLGRISGAKFETQAGDGSGGIALGTARDFPALKLENQFDATDPARREEYVLRSHGKGVFLIGATDAAVQNAVWDFLHRLGYRQFFPGKNWEIVPQAPSLQIAADVKTKPDYLTRRIWFTYGAWPENQKRMNGWSARNRTGGLVLNTGHAYAGIINRNKDEFAAHPEYISPHGDQRKAPATPREVQSVQFDISNPGLRQLVINDALKQFEENSGLDSISVDPNDGSAWGNSPEEQKLGSVSNRVTLLANEVAEAVNKRHPGKQVGFYAYNLHSPPPTIRVHPRVVVSVATAFLSGGYTVDQLLEGWQKQGATLGIREYYSIIHWDKDLPNRAKASRPEALAQSIAHFHQSGARYMSAESSDNWGPNGLGYYIASRVLWDVEQAENVPAIVEDFLEKSFGPAKEPMREFYGLLNGVSDAPARPLSDDYVGRMYRALQAAYAKTNDTAIRARLDDLALYARYVELFREYSSSQNAARQAAYEKLIRFSYAIRDRHMVHSLAIYRTGLRDKSVKIPDEVNWKVPDAQNTWKGDAVPSPSEIQAFIQTGIQKNPLLAFEPKSYSDTLVPATVLGLAPVAPVDFGNLRGTQNFYVWVEKPGEMEVGGWAGFQYRNRGNARVSVFEASDVDAPDEDGENGELIAPVALSSFEVPPDIQEHALVLKFPRAGLFRVQVTDRMMGSRLRFPAAAHVVVKSALGETTGFLSRWKAYFYVPKGTAFVGGFAYGSGQILDPAGKLAFDFPAKDGYFSIPVPAGQDGRLWSFVAANGQIGLMTVPPYLGRHSATMLVPREFAEAK